MAYKLCPDEEDEFDYEDEHIERESDKQEYSDEDELEFEDRGESSHGEFRGYRRENNQVERPADKSSRSEHLTHARVNAPTDRSEGFKPPGVTTQEEVDHQQSIPIGPTPRRQKPARKRSTPVKAQTVQAQKPSPSRNVAQNRRNTTSPRSEKPAAAKEGSPAKKKAAKKGSAKSANYKRPVKQSSRAPKRPSKTTSKKNASKTSATKKKR